MLDTLPTARPLDRPLEAAQETRRLAALAEYGQLDTPSEDDFDRLTRLASELFGVPMVLVSLVDANRQFFKSHIGIEVCELDRESSFCTHAIRQPDIFVVLDAASDPFFATNRLVTGAPHIRFYAGKTLVSPGGERLGTLCLIDTAPHATFSADEARNLRMIADLVMGQLELRRLERAQAQGRTRFENVAAHSPDAILCADATGGITFVNRAAERLFGIAGAEFERRPLEAIVAGRWRAGFAEAVAQLREEGAGGQTLELACLTREGAEFAAEMSFSAWQDGGACSVGVIVRDVSEHRRQEERLFRLASVDALTELPNRAAWRQTAAEVAAAGMPFTVLLLDLDGFKQVNDTLGHLAGDVVLCEVARRLRLLCVEATIAARLGGDEFVVMLPGADEARATALAAALIAAVSTPIAVIGETAEIGLSVGIAFGPVHGLHPDDACDAADLALYRAKAGGRGRCEVFAPALRQIAAARRLLEGELHRGIADGAFELFFQPRFALPDLRLSGVEALIRWNHPERGLLAPVQFEDMLRREASALALGEWVLRTGSAAIAAWRSECPGLRLGVNLFEAQLRSDALLVMLREMQEDGALVADALEFEVGGGLFAGDVAPLGRRLAALHALGAGLVLDDFGATPTPLTLFGQIPFAGVKLDRTLVRDLDRSPVGEALVAGTIDLMGRLGLGLTAKGVETEAQLMRLRALGCSDVQGYLLGRPLPRHEFHARFLAETPVPA